MIDFSGFSNHLWLFNTLSFGNCIYICMCNCFFIVFWHTVPSNMSSFNTALFNP